jgi:viroplasmin and RNaseH domain-containing protein
MQILRRIKGISVPMRWYVVFHGRVPGVYDSWPLCNEHVSVFAGTSCMSYRTKGEVESAYATFLKHDKVNMKPQVVQGCCKCMVHNFWTWKEEIMLCQFLLIIILCCKLI